ncbi:MAG TPA: Ig-like domain repeat protein [Terracidiphilus sp.]|nr:Ig-like domain repeat protein [Terracidiphilus sp.]
MERSVSGVGKETRASERLIRLIIIVVVTFALSSFLYSQSRITEPIDNTRLTALSGNTLPLAQARYDQGAVPSNFPADRMILVLKHSAEQEAALQSFLGQVQNPTSELYHQYVTPQQFGAQYGVAQGDIDSICSWLRSEGFTVNRILIGHTGIEFSGNAGQVQTAFHTAIHRYLVNGEQHYANSSDPQIPSALAPVVAGITLNDLAPKPMVRSAGEAMLDPITHRAAPLYNMPSPNAPFCLQGYCFAVVPGDFAAIYDTKPLLNAGIDGKGVTIGVVGDAPIDTSMVQLYRENFLPAYSAANVPNTIVDGPPPTVYGSGDELEAYLDVELAGGVAPNAAVNFYVGANSYVSSGVGLALARALDDNQVSVLSVSFGLCEAYLGTAGNQYFNNIYEQAAAQGITVLVSTGDTGSAACDPPLNTFGPSQAVAGFYVSGLASTPYDVAVGGTDFYYPANATLSTLGAYWNMPSATDPDNNNDWSSAKGYIPEKPWNDSDPTLDQVNLGASLAADGGGASSCVVYSGAPPDAGQSPVQSDCVNGYAKPAWQVGFGDDKARDLPDVSVFASDGSNYSFTAFCAFPPDCAVPNGGPNSTTAPLEVSGVGGTSVSAPAMAGIMALAVEKTQSRQGLANTVLYPLSQQIPQAFHDITVGTNRVGCETGTPDCGSDGYLTGYSAGPGYDMATGIGSVDAMMLVNNWSQVTFKPTATTLSINPTKAANGTALSFTVNVTGGPTSRDIALLLDRGSGNLNGQYTTTCASFPCTFSYAGLPGGSYSVAARFPGDSVYASSTSAEVPVTITAESSELAIYYQVVAGQLAPINGATLEYGMGVDFNVRPVPAGYTLPPSENSITSTPATGSITVTDNGTPVGSPLVLDSTGQAGFEGYAFAVGKHSLVASYPGDASYLPSNTISPLATPMNFTVTPEATTLELDPYYQEILPGAGATVLASLNTFGAAAPTGTVTFTITPASGSAVVLPAVPVVVPSNEGFAEATVNIPAADIYVGPPSVSAPANNTVSASYSGDANYLPGTQTSTAGIYDALAYTTTFVSTTPLTTAVAGQAIAITAEVGRAVAYPPYPGFPGGTIQFSDESGNLLATLPAASDGNGNGVATYTTSSLSVGVHTITASYSGDAQDQPSQGNVSIKVTPAPPDFTISGSAVTIPSGASNPSVASTLTLTLNSAATTASAFSVNCMPPSQSFLSCSVQSTVNIPAGMTAGTATITISVSGLTAEVEEYQRPGAAGWAATGGITLALLAPLGLLKRRKWRAFLGIVILLTAVIGLGSCGGSIKSNPNVPAGNYSVTVSAILGSVTHEATIPVTVQ